MKRRNGSGSIDRVGDRWRLRGYVEGRRRRIGPLHDTEELAIAALDAFERSRGLFEESSAMTLAGLGAEWLAHRQQHGSAVRQVVKTIDTERSVWDRHVLPCELAGKVVTAIVPLDVEALTLALRASPAVQVVRAGDGFERRPTGRTISRSQQKHALRLVRQCLAYGVRQSIIETNPADGVMIATGGPRPRDVSDDWLREHEIAALLACDAIALPDRVAYAVDIGTALRKDDLRLLEVARVAEDEIGPGIRVWIQKSETWHRVPVMPWLWPILKAHLEALPEGARFVFSPDADHLTPYAPGHSFGWPAKPSRLGRTPSALERAGIRRRTRFHDLRGTTATHLALGTWGRRWSLTEIQRMLVHSDQKVTERYVRHAETLLAEAARGTTGGPVGHGWPRQNGVSAAPPPGIEPGTVRLEGGPTSESGGRDRASRGQRVANAALALAAEVESGEVSAATLDAVRELAREDPMVAAYVGLDGPHALRAAMELVRMLGAADSARAERKRA